MRFATPLDFTEGAAHLMDAYAAAAGYRLEAGESAEEVRQVHVLVDMRRSKGELPLANDLLGNLKHAQEATATALAPGQVAKALHALAGKQRPANVHAVFALPQYSPDAETRFATALATLRAVAGQLAAVTAVAEDTQPWGEAGGVQGFVRPCAGGDLGCAAVAVYRVFTMLAAPVSHLELDVPDLLQFFGTAQAPAEVLSVPWHLSGWEAAHGVPPEDLTRVSDGFGGTGALQLQRLAAAAEVLACPMWPAPVLGARRAVQEALMDRAPRANVTVFFPDEHWSQGMERDRVPCLTLLLNRF